MAIASLGVCYYPEHWNENDWPRQAALMAEAGLSLVRIAEFAWSRVEPRAGEFHWDWLDRAVNTLADAGLGIIMCTPTACPPRWLIEQYPEVLPVDHHGRVRDFGSRRHYRFASEDYRRESLRISRAVIDRYSGHPAVVAWQFDNEYGCHDTTRSYAPDDLQHFQAWLAGRYSDIEALNTAWGAVFWSQEYASFADVGLPNLTVTEANPAHRMDYYRFASDQVVEFNREQAELVRAKETKHWLTHNFMGNFTDFDHFPVAEDLDVATWDSYPLGFLDQGWASDTDKLRYRRIGHPDWAAFHHDLYRAVGRGRFGVMEQQPGPVNWAPANADPLPGAPAFWAAEAIAHGAELVSFFRFQQLPRAQEQMHAALRLPNGDAAPAWEPVTALAGSLQQLPDADTGIAPVALLFDYASCWATEIQPHAPGTDSLRMAMDVYSAVRSLGLDVDIIGTHDDPGVYAIVIVPGTVFVDPAFVDRIVGTSTRALILARSGSRDTDFALPANLAPGALQALVPVRVTAVDSMRAGAERRCRIDDEVFSIRHWFESVETDLQPRAQTDDGAGFWYAHEGHHYLNGACDLALYRRVIADICEAADIPTTVMPEGLRVRRRGDLSFVFNFSPDERAFEVAGAALLLGGKRLAQGSWAVWQMTHGDLTGATE